MDIKKEIAEMVGDNSLISEIDFEVSNIIIYTKNKNFFLNNLKIIKPIINTKKKRIEVRLDPSLLMEEKDAEKEIFKIIPKSAELKQIWFERDRSIATLEALRPEMVNKGLDIIKDVKEKTGWSINLMRYPLIKSDIVKAVREMLYSHADFRKKLMNSIGEKIYNSKFEVNDKYWVRLSALGGFRQVGRSAVLIQTPISSVMLDAGLDVSNQKDFVPRIDAPEFDISKLDGVVITHSHLDHCGFLPVLYRYGYRGPVFSTAPTRDVMTLLHLDYLSLTDKANIKQLFSVDDIKEMLKYSIVLSPNEVTDITPDVRVTLRNSGHILGATMIHLNIGNGFHNILYTGDFKYANSKTLDKADNVFDRVETLIMESTYGGDNDKQPSRDEAEKFFFDIVKNTIEKGGKVLVPVLGVGRAQEIMLMMEEWTRYGMIPDIQVIVDGMLWDVTAIYTVYPEFMNSETRRRIIEYNNNPFLSPIFKHVVSEEERQKVLSGGPAIILATSGMLNGGPSVYYFANMCEDEKNAVVLVSYQGAGTIGRAISEGAKSIDIDFNGKLKHFDVNLQVYSIQGFSGHSDRGELERYVREIQPRPRRIVLDHGEESKIISLAKYIRNNEHIETIAPKILDAVRLH